MDGILKQLLKKEFLTQEDLEIVNKHDGILVVHNGYFGLYDQYNWYTVTVEAKDYQLLVGREVRHEQK